MIILIVYRVKFAGGREVDGILKGFDKLDNLVLDDCVEYLRGTTITITITISITLL